MADTTAKTGLKVIATTSEKIRELSIVDGQLIFIQDLTRIAFDFKGERKFYNQLTTLESDAERLAISSVKTGYYFVVDTAILWYYKDGWIQITEKPEEIVFVGDRVDFPELGQEKKIYVDIDDKEISVWNKETESYIAVANYTEEASVEDIDAIFE